MEDYLPWAAVVLAVVLFLKLRRKKSLAEHTADYLSEYHRDKKPRRFY
jgi:hypothetical protein